MNDAHTKTFLNDFPHLFRKLDNDPRPRDYWGFECGDGWYALIHQLCIDIEKAAVEAGLKPTDEGWPRALQIKEKFGTLRFYLETASVPMESRMRTKNAPFLEFTPESGIAAIRDLIAAAEQKSMTICERCGAPGTLYRDGWMVTMCQLCKARNDKRLKE